MNITPSDIEFMLYCYTQGFEPYPYYDELTLQECVDKFMVVGLIKAYVTENGQVRENCYKTTDKGAAWVKMLCNTPFPVQAWVDIRDNSVVE